MNTIEMWGQMIGDHYPPFVIAEIGINHEGNIQLAKEMIDAVATTNCNCVKFQCHIISEEMIPNDVVPGNSTESIWNIIERCQLSKEEEFELKTYTESKGLHYLCTPFSFAAVDRLEELEVNAYKVGSGECNHYPLIEKIAKLRKPVILSTGMNSIDSIKLSVEILENHKTPYALMQCTSIYPTPYDKVQLNAISELKSIFPNTVIGLSDHSYGIYTCLGAVSLGARILEKHFTHNKDLPGPDIPISIDTQELSQLVKGSEAIFKALGGKKAILKEEQPTIRFAYGSVVTTKKIQKNEHFTSENISIKRPGTGPFKGKDFEYILGRQAKHTIQKDCFLLKGDIQ